MRYTCMLIVMILFAGVAQGQARYEPAVIFLSPNETLVGDEVKGALAAYDKETVITDEIRKNFIPPTLAPNWKIIREKELAFIAKQNFSVVLIIALSRELTYSQVGANENLLIFPVKNTSRSDKASYKSLTEQYNVCWLVNMQKLSASQTGDEKKLEVAIQLYNVVADRTFLTKIYTVTSTTAGPCDDDVWTCLVEKIKKDINRDLADIVEKNRHYNK